MNRKSITPTGFFIIGFSCVFGSSWLLLPAAWLQSGKSFANVALGFLIGILLIFLLSFSYGQIFKAFPEGDGEIAYTRAAFGVRWAAAIGWCSFLVNVILCAWQTIAVTNILHNLFPQIDSAFLLYRINGYPITLGRVMIGLFIVFGSMMISLRGTKSSISLQQFLIAVILLLLLFSVFVSLPHIRTGNFSCKEPDYSPIHIISVIVLLPFSIAGWENIAKGTNEAASNSGPSKQWRAMAASIISGGILYFLLFAIQISILPPNLFSRETLPFISGLERITGNKVFGYIILTAAAINGVNVYNGMFYGATRALFSLGQQGYLPSVFMRTKGKNQVPCISILFVSLCSAAAPFFGQSAFSPLVNVSALLYIILWGSTVFSNFIIRKQRKIGQTFPEKIQTVLGMLIVIFMLGGMLIPQSPGALKWPSEYILTLLLIAGGFTLCKRGI